jgi:hypothetical protein
VFIQLASVKPYFDEVDLYNRRIEFEKRTDLDVFYLDASYAKFKPNEKPTKNPEMHQLWCAFFLSF